MRARGFNRVGVHRGGTGSRMQLVSACRLSPSLKLTRLCRAMSNLAAGKKAAAVQAVNDWVKV